MQVVGRYVHTVITYIHMHTHTYTIPSFSTVVALRGQNFRNMDLVASVWIRFVHAVVTSVMFFFGHHTVFPKDLHAKMVGFGKLLPSSGGPRRNML